MEVGDVVDGRFALEAIAGEGGMGAVYRARDVATGELVAVKVLMKSAASEADRFAREIRVLAQLRHPGIVRYLADGVTPSGEPWLAMEWLEGESLYERLARAGLTASESVELTRRIAEAVGAAHERGVIHRDVKPSNIMLVGGDLERVKVLDFGVARVQNATRAATRTGVMVGTPGYMAPEQVRGERDVGARSDVFALGCVLFECLTGKPAYYGDHIMAVLAKLVLEEPPRVSEVRPDVPEALDELVSRALSKAPEARPRDGLALAAALATVASEAAGETRAPTIHARVALTATERRLLCVVLIGPGASADGPPSTITDRVMHTVTLDLPDDTLGLLGATAKKYGGHMERLADGSYVVTLAGTGSAGDQVVQAARCALALRAVAPVPPIALATGRGVMAGRWPVGEAIDRAVALIGVQSPHVVVDEVTAGLLDARFEVGGDATHLALVCEHDVVAVTRTLLGRATPCVGRDRELGVLQGLFDECVSEPMARAVVLTGGPGVGKSRVRYELVKRLEAHAEVWLGRGDTLRAGSPYAVIAPALRRACGIREGEPAGVQLQKLRARVGRTMSGDDVATTAMFLGEIVGVEAGDEPLMRAAKQDPLLMSAHVQAAFDRFVAAEALAQPLVIVLEDLHWGDLPTVKLIDGALRAVPDKPWLVLALARPEVMELFPRLWAERGAQEIRLDELTRKSSERLVKRVLGDDAPAALVTGILDRAGGNAFYLEELIRAVAEGKGDAMPETVLAVVQGRLERLEGDARRVLRAASVFGQAFWRGGVTALLGGNASTWVQPWLDELVMRELISKAPAPRFPGENEYSFRSSLVREAAYAMLTDADRRLGHRLAGDWLATVGESDAMVLAEHFERGGEPTRAAASCANAAVRALAACDFRAAVARAERGVANGASAELLGNLRRVQAEAHKWSGELAKAATRGREAMSLLPAHEGAWFEAAADLAASAGRSGDADTLVWLGEELRAAPATGFLVAQVTATAHAAFQLWQRGDVEVANALLSQVESLGAVATDPAVLARVYQSRSSRAGFAGDAGAYLEWERAAAQAFTQAGDLRYACMQRGHVGYACLEIGAYADAERWLMDAQTSAEKLGLHNVVATAKHNLGRALQHQGRLAEALAVERESLRMFMNQGDQRLEGAARLYAGYILADQGDLAGAELEMRVALATAARPMRSQVLASLARVAMLDGRTFEAAALAKEAADLLDELGAIEEGEALVRLMLAETMAAMGDKAGARAAAYHARDRVIARAAAISDARARESFLTRIPDNARTIALAEEL